MVILAILLLCVMVGVFLRKRQQTADAKDPSYPTGGGVAPGVAIPKTAMATNPTYQVRCTLHGHAPVLTYSCVKKN